MAQKYSLLFILLIIVTIRSGFSQDIPDNRRFQWNKAGLSRTKFESSRLISITDYHADASGEIPADEALKAARTALKGKAGIIYFPAGTYTFNEPIVLSDSLVLKGAGNSTNLEFQLNGAEDAIQIVGKAETLDAELATSIRKNTESLELTSVEGLSTDDLLKITLKGESLVSSSWAEYSVGQIIEIIHLDPSGRVYSANWNRMNIDKNADVKLERIEPIHQVGIECMSITRLDATDGQTSNIWIENAHNVWIENVESHMTNFAHVSVKSSSNISIKGSHFTEAHSYGNNGKGYGVMLQFTSGECLVENNTFKKLRHAIILQAGANANVVGYNYSVDPFWTGVNLPENSAGDIVLHGNFPCANLFEGNVVQNIAIDDSHGANGPHNVFFKNDVDLFGFVMNAEEPTDSVAIIGNNVNNTGFLKGLYYTFGEGHYENSNTIRGKVLPEVSTNLKEASLYDVKENYRLKGSFKTNSSRIVAEQRYTNGDLTHCQPMIHVGQNERLQYHGLNLYPNPASHSVQIQVQQQTEVAIFSMSGKREWVGFFDSKGSINVEQLPVGVYNVVATSEGGQTSKEKLLVF